MLILRTETLSSPHAFFGRRGGISHGVHDSLNCSPYVGDGHENVVHNRNEVCDEMGAKILVTLRQTHSADVVTIDMPWQFGEEPQGDAIVTDMSYIALGILTADCAPVLFEDEDARVIGAAHAGWKGAVGGVIANTVAAMEALGARRSRIASVIGPCISQANYEVGAEFRTRFVGEDPAFDRYFVAGERPSHYRFDLPGFVAGRLTAAGVDRIETLDACTYGRPADFFSYRRATHAGEKDCGREISAIALR